MRIIKIGYLYGNMMNLYGDRGNILALVKRAQWRGIEVVVKNIEIGDRLAKGDFDIYFFGGGQDQSQDIISDDLKNGVGKILALEVGRGVPLLAICGGYQLLGKYYQPLTGPKIKGVGIFDAYTKAGSKRMVGNIALKINQKLQAEMGEPNTLIGFENHSGQTYLEEGVEPLGQVMVGSGNNGRDRTEGAVYKNAIGCYLHGSLLPKNPQLADWFLKKALQISNQEDTLSKLNDNVESQAHREALLRAKKVE